MKESHVAKALRARVVDQRLARGVRGSESHLGRRLLAIGHADVAQVVEERGRRLGQLGQPECAHHRREERVRHRQRDAPGELDDRGEGKHAVTDDVERARDVAEDGHLECRDGVGLVQELPQRVEPHHGGTNRRARYLREVVLHRWPHDRRGAQDGDQIAGALREAVGLGLGFDLVGEERLAVRRAKRVPLGEKIGVRGVRSVEHCLAPHDELADRACRAAFKRRMVPTDSSSCAHARAWVGDRERQVNEAIDALGSRESR